MNDPGIKNSDLSFEELYDLYYDRIYKYVYLLLLNREDAEDVTAETFLAAYNCYDSYDPSKASPATWLSRIAHNKAVNLLRSSAYTRQTELTESEDKAIEGNDYTDAEDRDMVLSLYDKLTPEERELLNMRYVMDLKDREVGMMIGVPEKTVNKRYQRLLAKCRTLMSEEGD